MLLWVLCLREFLQRGHAVWPYFCGISVAMATTHVSRTVAFVSEAPILRDHQESARRSVILLASKGFGSSNASGKKQSTRKRSTTVSQPKRTLRDALDEKPSSSETKRKGVTFNKSQQEKLLAELAAQAGQGCVGRAVQQARSLLGDNSEIDPFWELIPSLLQSKFPTVEDSEFSRIAKFVRHAINPDAFPVGFEEPDVDRNDPNRPLHEIHAYMPGLGPVTPFIERPSEQLEFCRELQDSYDTIKAEYHALMEDMKGSKNRFQSVTSMNYDSGWQTCVLFYNGHRIADFPYHLCPVTTRILENVPLAGRIAGFNRQQPQTGIPLHTDGNNMVSIGPCRWSTSHLSLVC
jgi:Aspartyl/Asparaginyl beta-hydroxylase